MYSNNVILNLDGQEWQVEALKRKMMLNGYKESDIKIINLNASEIINRNDLSDQTRKVLESINNNSRVYIIGHCCPRSGFLGNVHYLKLADYLEKGLNKDLISNINSNSKITFSLIACHAGIGDDTENEDSIAGIDSFAGRFHSYLGRRHKINSRVQSRTEISMIHREVDKVGKKTASFIHYGFLKYLSEKHPEKYAELMQDCDYLHQKPGTKVSFNWNKEGQQYLVDSYEEKFILKAAELLKERIENINNNPLLMVSILSFISKLEEVELIREEEVLEAREFLLYLKATMENNSKCSDLVSRIDRLLDFASKSISNDSKKPITLKTNIDDGFDGEDFDKIVTSEMFNPAVKALQSLFPKNSEIQDDSIREKLKKFKGITQSLQLIGNSFIFRKTTGLNVSSEEKLTFLICMAIKTAGSKSLTLDEKMKILQEIKKDIASIRPSDKLISQYIENKKATLEMSMRHGLISGVASYDDYSSYQENYVQELRGLIDSLDEWFEVCMSPDILNLATP